MSFRREFRAVPIHEGKKYRAIRRQRETAARLEVFRRTLPLFAAAGLIGLAIGLATVPGADGVSSGGNFFQNLAHEQGLTDDHGNASRTWYKNCQQARLAGAAPISRGSPGYRAALDADGDGVACEPYP